jgi:hypothetical protein
MSDLLAKRFEDAGLPYEITDSALPFVLSGAQKGRAVVALHMRGDVERHFCGFYSNEEAGAVARKARAIHGCYAAYTVQANEKD